MSTDEEKLAEEEEKLILEEKNIMDEEKNKEYEEQIDKSEMNNRAVEFFCGYLQIRSVHPNVNYDECVVYLTELADYYDFPFKVYNIYPGKPIFIITWVGLLPTEQSILLNSHMDVVPVSEDEWKYPPFGHIDPDGNIYGRGSQDTKCVGIQYLEAINRLRVYGHKLERTIHISFVPDKEIGGDFGMKSFVKSTAFKNLNVGFALDAGMASADEKFHLFYGEKSIWEIEIKCVNTHQTGLPMVTPIESAGAKFRYVLNHFIDSRTFEQNRQSRLNPWEDTLSMMTTTNLKQIWSRIEINVEPPELNALFEIHLSQTIDRKEFENTIEQICQKIGPGVIYSFKRKDPKFKETNLDSLNPYWTAFKKTCDENDIKLRIRIRPTSSDSRFLREENIPVLGFSPINKTRERYHDYDEYLNKDTFLKGIEIYTKILPALAKVGI